MASNSKVKAKSSHTSVNHLNGQNLRVQDKINEIKTSVRFVTSTNQEPHEEYVNSLRTGLDELERRLALAQESLRYFLVVVTTYQKHCLKQLEKHGLGVESAAFRIVALQLQDWFYNLRVHYNVFRYLYLGHRHYDWQRLWDATSKSTYPHRETSSIITRFSHTAVQDDCFICEFATKRSYQETENSLKKRKERFYSSMIIAVFHSSNFCFVYAD